MPALIHDDFLLNSKHASQLYHEYAEAEPILDYHCHLPPQDVASNRRFANLHDIWLEGDHYKWRAMRTNGVDERFCTGDAEPYEKFLAWAKTVPHTLRNPLYHWTHIELKRYFNMDVLLNEDTAREVWETANAQLAQDDLTTQGIFKKFNIKAICTTDDPVDNLQYHADLANQKLDTKMFPAFRPDKALTIDTPNDFNAWLDCLAEAADIEISSLDHLTEALDKRHEFFHQMGSRISDHGLEYCFASPCDKAEAAKIFNKARQGNRVSHDEREMYCSYMMEFFGQLDAKRGWTKQLHLGALRNNNSRLMKQLGPDTGFDSIGDWPQAQRLAQYLDQLDSNNTLPKTIIYNLNPADNYVFATMLGNFQNGKIAGKIQLGSGWWFLDQLEGMRWQIDALSSLGLLSRFVGMLTDSRSFMSYPRHEYFRRLLCDMLGQDMQQGKLPNDMELIGSMIKRICYQNAHDYLKLPLG